MLRMPRVRQEKFYYERFLKIPVYFPANRCYTLCRQEGNSQMPTISEPRTERDVWTFNRCRNAFVDGHIGADTFRVSLQLLGMSPRDAQTEVNLAKMERK